MLLCAVSVFAIDLSVGGSIDYSIQGRAYVTGETLDWTGGEHYSHLLGINAFFDAQYVRISLGGNWSVEGVMLKTLAGDSLLMPSSHFRYRDIHLSNFDLCILGKYPIKSGIAKLSPMVGFDFAINVYTKDSHNIYSAQRKDLHHVYFLAGFSSDIELMSHLFISPSVLFGIDLKKPSNYKTKKNAAETAGLKYMDNSLKFNLGISIGYTF